MTLLKLSLFVSLLSFTQIVLGAAVDEPNIKAAIPLMPRELTLKQVHEIVVDAATVRGWNIIRDHPDEVGAFINHRGHEAIATYTISESAILAKCESYVAGPGWRYWTRESKSSYFDNITSDIKKALGNSSDAAKLARTAINAKEAMRKAVRPPMTPERFEEWLAVNAEMDRRWKLIEVGMTKAKVIEVLNAPHADTTDWEKSAPQYSRLVPVISWRCLELSLGESDGREIYAGEFAFNGIFFLSWAPHLYEIRANSRLLLFSDRKLTRKTGD